MHNYMKVLGISVICLLLGFGQAFAKGDTLTVGVTQTPKTLDPQATSDAGSQNIDMQIYETLVTMDKDNNLVPMLAEKWEALPDKVSYKFHLKKGVKFHNGETMTADDVVFTFKRALSPAGVPCRGGVSTFEGICHPVKDGYNRLAIQYGSLKKLPFRRHAVYCALSRVGSSGSSYGKLILENIRQLG